MKFSNSQLTLKEDNASRQKTENGFYASLEHHVALHPSSLQRTVSTPHSSGFARLEFGAFYFAIEF
jgi:hypothetical protein